MHDFCFTIPYGLILVCGGAMGYASKGSIASLAGGVGTGFALILAGYLSLQAFHKRKNSYFALILETACAATLTWVMGQRYMQTSKIMPAGVVAGISYVAWTLQNVTAPVSDPRKMHYFLRIRLTPADIVKESKQYRL